MAADTKPNKPASIASPPLDAGDANIERLLDETEKSLDSLSRKSPTGDAIRFDLPTWDGVGTPHIVHAPPQTQQPQLDVTIEFGRTSIIAHDAQQLCDGSVVLLDRGDQDLVDVYIGKNLVARGEVQVMNGHFCVRVAELIARNEASGN